MASLNGSLWWILGLSSLMFVVSMLLAGVMIVALPTDYLTREQVPETTLLRDRPLLRGVASFLKNGAGLLFLIAGAVMLLTPGQGLLFIFLGLTLLDFPGKRKLLQKLLRRPAVTNTINKVRARFGRQPLEQ